MPAPLTSDHVYELLEAVNTSLFKKGWAHAGAYSAKHMHFYTAPTVTTEGNYVALFHRGNHDSEIEKFHCGEDTPTPSDIADRFHEIASIAFAKDVGWTEDSGRIFHVDADNVIEAPDWKTAGIITVLGHQTFCGMHPALWDTMKDKGCPNWRTEGLTASPAAAMRWVTLLSEEEIHAGLNGFNFERVASILKDQNENAMPGKISYYKTIDDIASTVRAFENWSMGEIFVYPIDQDKFVIMKQVAPASCEMLTVTQNGYHDVLTAYRYDQDELINQLNEYVNTPAVAEINQHNRDKTKSTPQCLTMQCGM